MDDFIEREIRSRAQAAQHRLQNTIGYGKGWELEKLLSTGSSGMTFLIKDSDPLHRRRDHTREPWVNKQRRVVLKWALFPEAGIDDFITEMKSLAFLRGKAHHVQMIAATADVATYRPPLGLSLGSVLRVFTSPWKNPPINIFKIIRRHRGPAILLEYLEDGSLQQLSHRAKRTNVRFPNRLLWSFYFCMVRGCVGMNFPQEIPESGAPLVLETITRLEPNGFSHNDIALRNIMVDRYDLQVPEHIWFPRLKFIDYGSSTISPTPYPSAARNNLLQVAAVMIHLINPDARPFSDSNAVVFNGIETYATDILPQIGGDDMFPLLDPELRQLLVEALAVNMQLRPSIHDMFVRVQAGREKPSSAYPNQPIGGNPPQSNEENMYIQQLLRFLIDDVHGQ
ncbi:hypothetical protein F4803DRAFT_570946 [Xylaria telfairii]|nr:hypothetical protein F4803DRAFT_570946 [Xylaria telfairii]